MDIRQFSKQAYGVRSRYIRRTSSMEVPVTVAVKVEVLEPRRLVSFANSPTVRPPLLAETPRQNHGANALAVQKDSQSRSATYPPSLYVLNAAALTKPYAVQHLATDLTSYNIDVAIINETHCKSKHSDSVVSVDGYVMYR